MYSYNKMAALEKLIEKFIDLLEDNIILVEDEEESSVLIKIYTLGVRNNGNFFYKFLNLKKRIYKLIEDSKDKKNYKYIIYKLFKLSKDYKKNQYKISLFLAKLIYKLLNLHLGNYYFSLQDLEFLYYYLCENDIQKIMSNLEIERPYVFDKHDESYYDNCILFSTN